MHFKSACAVAERGLRVERQSARGLFLVHDGFQFVVNDREPNEAERNARDWRPEVATNNGREYTDDQLILVLSTAPTKANAVLLAPVLGRSPAGIEWIWRCASLSQNYVRRRWATNAFVAQVRRVAKSIEWVS
jgi:hypothetical protein